MKRVLLSGGILAGDVLAHAWSGFPTSPAATGVGISLATAMGLALAIRYFAVVFAQAVSAATVSSRRCSKRIGGILDSGFGGSLDFEKWGGSAQSRP